MSILCYIVITLLAAFGVAAFMEYYKKQLRHDEAKKWEIMLVGAAVSILVAVAGVIPEIFYWFVPASVAGACAYNLVIYAVVFFVVQWLVDMNIIKKIIAAAVDTMDIEVFIYNLLKKCNLTVDQVKEAFAKFDVTKEKFAKFMADCGFTQKQIDEAIAIFF